MLSNLRCPNTRCLHFGRRLEFNAGQDDYAIRGLTVEHRCGECGYVERGPSTVESARRTSATVRKIAADRLLAQRLSGFTRDTGVEVPMVYDDDPEEVADV